MYFKTHKLAHWIYKFDSNIKTVYKVKMQSQGYAIVQIGRGVFSVDYPKKLWLSTAPAT